MTRTPGKLIPDDFPAVPGVDDLEAITVSPGTGGADAVGFVVSATGDAPAGLGLGRDALEHAGFDGGAGETLVVPRAAGAELVAVGVADPADAAALRDAAAAFVRAASRHARVALVVPGGDLDPAVAVQAIVEGAALARYRYTPLKHNGRHVPLVTLGIALPGADDAVVAAGARAAVVAARAAIVARDLANTPPAHLTAPDLADIAVRLGHRFGFGVEVFDKEAVIALGCGGLLGVNRGSANEPRMIKLSYEPAGAASGHLGLVGKGIMYDSGGINLKPSDPIHLLMKLDMGGAGAVLGAFCALRDRGVSARVTGWLSCTDNMPSSRAYVMGDVLTTHGGTTIEVKNTDAEGRLVMSDAFDLAVEEGVDGIVSIATLTGAALMALGTARAPMFANDPDMARLVLEAADTVDEPAWRFPLERKYRPQLESRIADISNLGGPYAGSTTAALFLEHFAAGTPWAHLDIVGTMQTEKDDSWRPAGATGYGARLLLEAAARFTA